MTADADVTEEELAAALGDHACECGKVFEVERCDDSSLLVSHPEPVCAWFMEKFVTSGLVELMTAGGSA